MNYSGSHDGTVLCGTSLYYNLNGGPCFEYLQKNHFRYNSLIHFDDKLILVRLWDSNSPQLIFKTIPKKKKITYHRQSYQKEISVDEIALITKDRDVCPPFFYKVISRRRVKFISGEEVPHAIHLMESLIVSVV